MERNNRDVRRGLGTVRVKNNVSEEEERAEDEDVTEARNRERSKREKTTSFHGGHSSSSSSKSQHKRKHAQTNLIQKHQNSSDVTEEVMVLVEEEEEDITLGTKILALESDESRATKILALESDESRAQPVPRKFVKARVQTKADEFVMDIPYIPRKARSSISSSSRATSISRRDQESFYTLISRRQKSLPALLTPLNEGGSQKSGRRPGISESLTMSDEEAEVAEALFVLASGMASQSDLMESKGKTEVRGDSSPSVWSSVSATIQNSSKHDNTDYSSHHAKDTGGPFAEALKRKRLRAAKQDEKRAYTPMQSASTFDIPHLRNSSVGVSEPKSAVEKAHILPADSATYPSEKTKSIVESCVETFSNKELKIQGLRKQGEAEIPNLESNRELEFGKKPSDLSAMKLMEANSIVKQESSSSASSAVHNHETMTECKTVVPFGKSVIAEGEGKSSCTDETSAKQDGLKDAVFDFGLIKTEEKASRHMKEQKQEPEAQMHGQFRNEKFGSPIVREMEGSNEKGKEKKYSKNVYNFQNCETATVSSNVPVSSHAGWMSGLPYMGYYKSGGMPWARGMPLPNSNLDVTLAHPTLQLPHAVVLPPIPKAKRCATHVYLAHYIHREQQLSRHSLWSTAFCRSTPYNLNMPPCESSYGYALSQAATPGVMSGSTAQSLTKASDASISASSENGHTQYMQAMMMQTNGFAAFPFPYNGASGQAAQFFNAPLFQPHLLPSVSHLYSSPQHGTNAFSIEKQETGSNLAHSIPSQTLMPQHQSHPSLQSPSQSQQPQTFIGRSRPHVGPHLEKDSSAVGIDSDSTAESRLQKSVSAQVSSSLPNLNASPRPLVLATGLPAMTHYEHDVSVIATSKGNQTSKPGHQFPFGGLNAASTSGSTQQKHFASQNIKHASLEVTSFTGSTEISRFHPQEQQHAYGGYNQQYQRNIPKLPSVNEESYSLKGRDCYVDKKTTTKQVGISPPPYRSNVEASSASLQDFPNSLESALRVPSKEGLSCSLGPLPEIGQGPLLQNQPSKQVIICTESLQGAMQSAHPILERNLPFSGPTTSTSNQSAKKSNSAVAKGMQKIIPGIQPSVSTSSTMSKRDGQLSHINLTSVPFTPSKGVTQSSGNGSMINQQLLPQISKSGISSTSLKTPSNGKGNASLTKSSPTLSAMSLSVKAPVEQKRTMLQGNNGHTMSIKSPVEQKKQCALQAQQESVQPSQAGSKNHAYSHQKQQQVLFKSSVQQQDSPQRSQSFLQQQHLPSPIVHHYQQNSEGSHGYVHYSVSTASSSSDKNGMAINSPSWSSVSGQTVNGEGADQFKGSGPWALLSGNRMADTPATLPKHQDN